MDAPGRVAAVALGSAGLALVTAVAALGIAWSLDAEECGARREAVAVTSWLASAIVGAGAVMIWGYGRWALRPARGTAARRRLAAAIGISIVSACVWVAAFVPLVGYGWAC